MSDTKSAAGAKPASSAKRFPFEGEELTVSEIRKRVPALSDQSIRSHLAAGRNSAQAMLTHFPPPPPKPKPAQNFVIGPKNNNWKLRAL
jgi:hypothetical protein